MGTCVHNRNCHEFGSFPKGTIQKKIIIKCVLITPIYIYVYNVCKRKIDKYNTTLRYMFRTLCNWKMYLHNCVHKCSSCSCLRSARLHNTSNTVTKTKPKINKWTTFKGMTMAISKAGVKGERSKCPGLYTRVYIGTPEKVISKKKKKWSH